MLIVLRSIIREYFLHKWRHVRELWHHPSSLPYQYSQYLKIWVVDSHASSLRRKRFRVACVQTSPISFVATKGNRRRLKAGKFPCSLGAKNEERESKTTQENGASKRAGRGLLFHFSRGQNRESRSSVFLYSETKRKRLLRRLPCIRYQKGLTQLGLNGPLCPQWSFSPDAIFFLSTDVIKGFYHRKKFQMQTFRTVFYDGKFIQLSW